MTWVRGGMRQPMVAQQEDSTPVQTRGRSVAEVGLVERDGGTVLGRLSINGTVVPRIQSLSVSQHADESGATIMVSFRVDDVRMLP